MDSSHCAHQSSWNLICNGEYPEDMSSKYGGYMIKEGEPYSVFSSEPNPRHYLVFFRSLDVAKCKTLDLVNSTFLRCFANVGKPTPLHYPRSRLTCVNYSLRMADELVSFCTTRYLPDNEYCAILYAEYDEKALENIRIHNRSFNLSGNAWLVLVLVLILLFFIFRLR